MNYNTITNTERGGREEEEEKEEGMAVSMSINSL
jgi:hypothetical protein